MDPGCISVTVCYACTHHVQGTSIGRHCAVSSGRRPQRKGRPQQHPRWRCGPWSRLQTRRPTRAAARRRPPHRPCLSLQRKQRRLQRAAQGSAPRMRGRAMVVRLRLRACSGSGASPRWMRAGRLRARGGHLQAWRLPKARQVAVYCFRRDADVVSTAWRCCCAQTCCVTGMHVSQDC